MKEKEKIHLLMSYVARLNPFEKGVDEFLSSLLHELMTLIPEADCGSAFIYEEGKVRFVDSVGYDIERLRKMELNAHEFKLEKNEVHLLKNTLEYHSEETRKKFESVIKPLKESIVFDLEINGKNVAGIGIDILEESDKHFEKESVMVAKLFKNLATNAFKIKLLQEELKKSEEKFKLVSEFSPIGIAMIDTTLKFTYVNRTACETTGYSKEELIGMDFLRIVHPDFAKKVKDRGLKRLNGAPAIENYDIKIKTKSGETRWIDIRSTRTLIFGEPVLIISALDIDNLKKIQKRKDEIMKRYELALEASQISVFDYDVNEKKLEVSKEIFSQLGMKVEKFRGTFEEFKKMLHPHDAENLLLRLREHLRGKTKEFQVEYRMRSQNGWKWILARGKVIERDDKGRPLKLFGVMSNVDTQKRFEEKLREYATYDELTGAYNRRTGLAILEEKMEYAKRTHEPLSICFVDINNLKNVNDSFGHAIGDDMIRNSVKLVTENIRKSDILCRMGGDEFLVIFPSCTMENAEKNWENVKSAISNFNTSQKKPYKIVLSHGCAQYDYKISQDEFVALSDRRMYEEKKRFKEKEKWSLR